MPGSVSSLGGPVMLGPALGGGGGGLGSESCITTMATPAGAAPPPTLASSLSPWFQKPFRRTSSSTRLSESTSRTNSIDGGPGRREHHQPSSRPNTPRQQLLRLFDSERGEATSDGHGHEEGNVPSAPIPAEGEVLSSTAILQSLGLSLEINGGGQGSETGGRSQRRSSAYYTGMSSESFLSRMDATSPGDEGPDGTLRPAPRSRQGSAASGRSGSISGSSLLAGGGAKSIRGGGGDGIVAGKQRPPSSASAPSLRLGPVSPTTSSPATSQLSLPFSHSSASPPSPLPLPPSLQPSPLLQSQISLGQDAAESARKPEAHANVCAACQMDNSGDGDGVDADADAGAGRGGGDDEKAGPRSRDVSRRRRRCSRCHARPGGAADAGESTRGAAADDVRDGGNDDDDDDDDPTDAKGSKEHHNLIILPNDTLPPSARALDPIASAKSPRRKSVAGTASPRRRRPRRPTSSGSTTSNSSDDSLIVERPLPPPPRITFCSRQRSSSGSGPLLPPTPSEGTPPWQPVALPDAFTEPESSQGTTDGKAPAEASSRPFRTHTPLPTVMEMARSTSAASLSLQRDPNAPDLQTSSALTRTSPSSSQPKRRPPGSGANIDGTAAPEEDAHDHSATGSPMLGRPIPVQTQPDRHLRQYLSPGSMKAAARGPSLDVEAASSSVSSVASSPVSPLPRQRELSHKDSFGGSLTSFASPPSVSGSAPKSSRPAAAAADDDRARRHPNMAAEGDAPQDGRTPAHSTRAAPTPRSPGQRPSPPSEHVADSPSFVSTDRVAPAPPLKGSISISAFESAPRQALTQPSDPQQRPLPTLTSPSAVTTTLPSQALRPSQPQSQPQSQLGEPGLSERSRKTSTPHHLGTTSASSHKTSHGSSRSKGSSNSSSDRLALPKLPSASVTPAPPPSMYWSKTPAHGSVPKRCFRAHTASLCEDTMWLFGGCDSKGCFGSVWCFDVETMCWSKPRVNGDVPSPRRAHSATMVDKRLYVFAGGDGPHYFQDLYVFDTVSLRWSKPEVLGNSIPTARRAHSANYWNGHIVIFGGGNGVGALSDVWLLDVRDPSRLEWKRLNCTGKLPIGRGYHTGNVVDDKLIVIGGSDGHMSFNDIHVLRLDTQTWYQVKTDEVHNRLGHTSTQVGSYLFIFGGHDSRAYSNEILTLNLVNLQWEPRRVCGKRPAGRGYHQAWLKDSRLFIHGGFDGKEVFDDLYLLDLAACSYLPQITQFNVVLEDDEAEEEDDEDEREEREEWEEE